MLREGGSGTLEVIKAALGRAGIRIPQLNVVMRLGSTEGIKAFVRNSDAMAIVSVISVVDELRSGVQTIQYQINTLMTTNGQSPFVTLFLYLRLSSGSSSSSQGPTVDRAGFLAQPRRAYLP